MRMLLVVLRILAFVARRETGGFGRNMPDDPRQTTGKPYEENRSIIVTVTLVVGCEYLGWIKSAVHAGISVAGYPTFLKIARLVASASHI